MQQLLKLQAPATLKKLPIFGFNANENQFEWPTFNNIIGFELDKPIKVVSFKYRARNTHYMHSIQVTLSNG
jgi:hypothetical protein